MTEDGGFDSSYTCVFCDGRTIEIMATFMFKVIHVLKISRRKIMNIRIYRSVKKKV